MSNKRRSKHCPLCANKVRHLSRKDRANNIKYLTKMNKIFKVNIDTVEIPQAPICRDCQRVLDSSSRWYKMCHSRIERLSKKPKTFGEASAQTDPSHNVIIINQLPYMINRQDLEKLFLNYGSIESIEMRRAFGGERFAFVRFSSEDAIERVLDAARGYGIRYESEKLMVTNLSGQANSIDSLPDDCLQEIFRKLDDIYDRINVEQVCKKWRNNARRCWSNFTCLRYTDHELPDLKPVIIKYGSFLKHLYVSLTDDSPNATLQFVAKHCETLETFKMYCHFNNEITSNDYLHTVRKIMQKMSKLRRFSIDWIRNDFDHDCLKLLPKELLEIHFFGDEDITTSMELSKFTDLRALELVHYELGEDSLIGIEVLSKLEYLSLSKSHVHPNNIRKIAHFTKLKFLEIPDCQINDDTLTRIAVNNRNLRYLDISENSFITDSSFYHVTRLPNLRVLIMNNVKHVTGLHLKNMVSLRRFHCNACDEIGDLELLLLFDSSPNLKRLEASGIVTRRFIISIAATLDSQDKKREFYIGVDEKLDTTFSKKQKTPNGMQLYPILTDDPDTSDEMDRDHWYSETQWDDQDLWGR